MTFGPHYSVGPILSTNVNASDVQTWINQSRDSLLFCNWTLVGSIASSGGTTGYELKSFPTSINAIRIRVKLFWSGLTTVLFGWPIVQIAIGDEDGNDYYSGDVITIRNDLGVKNLRLICGPHQFFFYYDTTLGPAGYASDSFNRNTAFAGAPYLFKGFTPGERAYWFQFNGRDFRSDLVPDNNTVFGFKINGIVRNGLYTDHSIIAPQLFSMRGAGLLGSTAFYDGNFPVVSPLLMLGLVSSSYACSIYDAIVVGCRFTTKTVTIADFHNWENLTLGGEVGTLFLATGSNLKFVVPGFAY